MSSPGPTALVIGGASWNLMVHVDEFPSPRPQTVFARRSNETVGSSGAGKALNLAAFGWRPALWALLGDDAAGDAVRSTLAAAGVEVLSVTDPAGTMRHVNLMDAAGDRISIFAATGTLDLAVDPAAVVERARTCDLVAVTIFEHCRAFLGPLRDAGVPLWIDVHDFDGRNPYHGDFVEAANHLQLSTVALPGWRAFAEERLAAGAATVACTHGAAGASVLTSDGWVEVPPVPTAVVDTNGAGDAWFAGFADAIVAGASAVDAATSGARAAAAAIASDELAPRR